MTRILITGSTTGVGRATPADRPSGRGDPQRRGDRRARPAAGQRGGALSPHALMAAVARLRPDVHANAVDPGWVPTRMGGLDAAEDLDLAHVTQAWLATTQDPEALSSGGHWHHGRVEQTHPAVHDERFQHELITALAEHTGTHLRNS